MNCGFAFGVKDGNRNFFCSSSFATVGNKNFILARFREGGGKLDLLLVEAVELRGIEVEVPQRLDDRFALACGAEVVLGDLSFEALEVANQNIERHGVDCQFNRIPLGALG